MSKDDPKRAARLAEALRANLHRRKARQRGEADAPEEAGPVPPAGERD